MTGVDSYDIYLYDSSEAENLNNTFINSIYDSDSESVSSHSEIIRKGYFSAIVANVTYFGDSSPIPGENVSLKNSSNDVLSSNISNAQGKATLDLGSQQLLKFYTNHGGVKTQHLYFYTFNSSSVYIPQTTNPSWNSLLNGTSKINGQIQDIKMYYTTYIVGGTQTLHDVYSNINNEAAFSNLSSVSKPCRYTANVSMQIEGNLIIEGCILEIDSEWDYRDLVLNNGGSLIVNYSNITDSDSYNPSEADGYNFYSLGNSNLILKNSYIDYVGTADLNYKRGLAINSTSLVFENISMSINRRAITLYAPNLTISNSRISGSSGSYGDNIRVAAPGARIVNCNLSDSAAGRSDIVIDSGMDVAVINSNYSNVGFQSGAKLYRKWWYRAYVNDTFDNNISNANVTVYNKTLDYQFNLTTNSSGWTKKTEIMDYLQNSSGDKIYYSNYTIYARSDNYTYVDSKSINITSQRNIYKHIFTLDNPPIVSLISATSTTYTYNVSDGNSIVGCSLILGGSSVATDNDVSHNGTTETITYSTPVGTHSYYITCTDDLGEIGNSSSSVISVSERRVDVGGGGGGGGGAATTISMKVTMPASKSIERPGEIILPVSIKNTGSANLYDINLSSYVLESEVLRRDISTNLDKNNLSSIASGREKNVTLRVLIGENRTTTYEIVLNVTSHNPYYNTEATTLISFIGENASGVRKMIVFTEETVVGNPECLELREMVEQAKSLYEQGKYDEAMELSRKAVEACKEMLEGPKKDAYLKDELSTGTKIIIYLAVGLFVAILFGVLFNLIRKIIFNKRLDKFKKEQQPQQNK
jgi:hypothetical protein